MIVLFHHNIIHEEVDDKIHFFCAWQKNKNNNNTAFKYSSKVYRYR